MYHHPPPSVSRIPRPVESNCTSHFCGAYFGFIPFPYDLQIYKFYDFHSLPTLPVLSVYILYLDVVPLAVFTLYPPSIRHLFFLFFICVSPM